MQAIVDDVVVENDPTQVKIVAALVVLVFALKGAATYANKVILAGIGNSIVAGIQKRLYRKVLSQDMAFHQRMQAGDLVTHMSTNTAAVRRALELIVTSAGRDLLTVIALVIVMFVKDPLISLMTLVIAPVAIGGIAYLVRRVKKVARDQFGFLAAIVTGMQETGIGIRIIKAFNLEERMTARMDSSIESVEARANRMAVLDARSSPIMETLGGFAIATVILYAGWAVTANGKTPGEVIAFLTAMLLAYDPAKRLAKMAVGLRGHLVGASLLYEVLDSEPDLIERADATPLALGNGGVRFDNVTFAYGESPALNQITLDAAPKSVTALVGPSGAGKSTVVTLLERFADPQSGTITIDGMDIRDATIHSLREHIAFVSQDTFLFAGTVRENIAFGREGATDAQIEQAARDANAHEFIERMQGGYDAPVGTDGDNLSGGQRQRIAIARAMVRDAPILLLDEATSALDAQSETKVQQALERLMQGRTTIVIAHRLSTIRQADMIHVLDQGKVVQSGTHESLIREGGLYASLHALQFHDSGG
jgi:ATP-binding cassette subfamily B protein